MRLMRFLSTLIALTYVLAFAPPEKHPGTGAASGSQYKQWGSLRPDSSANPYYIIIKKSEYELKVYDEEGWYATYPIVFGSKDLSDKMCEGDRRTPNGKFKVLLKKMHPKWGPELLLDYPTPENVQRFNERRKKGQVPSKARIGNGIAIHGTRPEEEWTVDNNYNWTDGCVSVKYTEMQDLFSYIPVGTPVTILP